MAEQVTTANARIGPSILDGASPFDRRFSSEKAAGALVRAWLTSDVGQKKMDDALKRELADFIEHFEEVFDRDWPYTKSMLGIRDMSDEDKKKTRDLLEPIFGKCDPLDAISPGGTFLEPKVEDPNRDWGNRELLLQSYRRLLPLLKAHGILPDMRQ